MNNIIVKYFDLREISDEVLDNHLDILKKNNNIDKNRINKSLSFMPDKSKKQSILANVLIDNEIKEKARNIYYNSKNKPIINDNLYFNISHSEDHVVFVKDNNKIGIDIEYIDLKNEDVLDYAFTKEEIDYIKRNYKDNLKEGIIKLWTIKEAVYKASGETSDIEPKDIKININDFSKVSFFNNQYNIISLKIDNYYMTIASINEYDDIVFINELSKEV